MPALDFTEAKTLPGANGIIYIFGIKNFNVYKAQGLYVYKQLVTDVWEAEHVGTFSELFSLLNSIPAPTTLFAYYVGNGALYIFAATSVDTPHGANYAIFKRKRGFKRVDNPAAMFDVYDHHFSILIDYAEQMYASIDGRRIGKEAQKRIDEFEDSLVQNLEPE
jgi:hypothetical protein